MRAGTGVAALEADGCIGFDDANDGLPPIQLSPGHVSPGLNEQRVVGRVGLVGSHPRGVVLDEGTQPFRTQPGDAGAFSSGRPTPWLRSQSWIGRTSHSPPTERGLHERDESRVGLFGRNSRQIGLDDPPHLILRQAAAASCFHFVDAGG